MLAFTRYLIFILPTDDLLLVRRKKLICHKKVTNQFSLELSGADRGTRTPDLILTMDALYHLSYIGKQCKIIITTNKCRDNNKMAFILYFVQNNLKK